MQWVANPSPKPQTLTLFFEKFHNLAPKMNDWALGALSKPAQNGGDYPGWTPQKLSRTTPSIFLKGDFLTLLRFGLNAPLGCCCGLMRF